MPSCSAVRGPPTCWTTRASRRRLASSVPPSGAGTVAGAQQPRLVREGDNLHPVSQVELGEDAGHVALHRRRAEEEPGGDLRVAQPAGDHVQDLQLPCAQPLRRLAQGVPPWRHVAELVDQPVGDGRGEQGVAHVHGPDRGGELLARRVLQEEAAGSRAQSAVHVLVQVEGGEHKDAGARARSCEPGGGLDAVQLRHPHVHDDDVGVVPPGLREGLHPGARLADDLEVGFGVEHEPQPLPHQVLVVGQHQPDHAGWSLGRRARTPNPPSGRGPAVSSPPNNAARSRIPVRPWPGSWSGCPGAPSSVTSTVTHCPSHRTATIARAEPACLRTLVSDSCTIRYTVTASASGRDRQSSSTRSSTGTPASLTLAVSETRSPVPGCGASSGASESLRRMPSRRRIWASDSRPLFSIFSRVDGPALPAARAPAACITTTLSVCEMTSCSSRASLARSSAAARCSSCSRAVSRSRTRRSSRRPRTNPPSSHTATSAMRKKEPAHSSLACPVRMSWFSSA